MIKNENIKVICPKENLRDNDEITLNIQKIILISLHEEKRINLQQYNDAVEYIEKKYKQR